MALCCHASDTKHIPNQIPSILTARWTPTSRMTRTPPEAGNTP